MTETKKNYLCPKCQMPLEKQGSGSLTQWMLVCNCIAMENMEPSQSISICGICGKRVGSGRAGTLTQWIFRADLCSCEAPEVVLTQLSAAAAESPISPEEIIEEELDPALLEELGIDSGNFPLERYKPMQLLGRGASGSVFLCKDTLLNKHVAVKSLHSLSNEQLIQFQREAKATSQLTHPNIVIVLDFGATDGGYPYMVMDYIAGLNLEKLLETQGTFDVFDTVEIFEQICNALSYSHQRSVFHRDVKPSNIIVSKDDFGGRKVHLIDFGVGAFKQELVDPRDSQSKTVVGTPAYMSPDQASGQVYDERSEIYSVGCVVFEMLTGKPPLVGATALDTISLHAHQEAPPLSSVSAKQFPKEIEDIVARCLKKNQKERYQNVSALKNALEEFATTIDRGQHTQTVIIESPSGVDPLKATGIAVAGLLLLFSVCSIVYMTWRSESKIVEKPPVSQDSFFTSLEEKTWHYQQLSEWHRPMGWVSNPYVRDEDFKLLQKESDVGAIDISYNDSLTGEGFKYVVNKPIKLIALQSSGLTDKGLEWICKIKTIEFLRIALAPDITYEGVKHLAELPRLRELEFIQCKIPDGTFDTITKMQSVRGISLYNSKNVSLKSVETLQRGLPNLYFLDLTGTNLNNDVIPIIVKFEHLASFRLTKCYIDDSNLELLCQMRALQELDLSGTAITDRGLKKLEGCRNLSLVNLSDCKKITHKGVSRLQSALPKLRTDGMMAPML